MENNTDKDLEIEMAIELKADCYSSKVARKCFSTQYITNNMFRIKEKQLKYLIYLVYKRGAADAINIKNFMENK